MNLSRVFCVSVVILMIPQEMYGMLPLVQFFASGAGRKIEEASFKCITKQEIKVSDRLAKKFINFSDHAEILRSFPADHDRLCWLCREDATQFSTRKEMREGFLQHAEKYGLRDTISVQSFDAAYGAMQGDFLERTYGTYGIILEKNGGPLYDGSTGAVMLAMLRGVRKNYFYGREEKKKFIGPVLSNKELQKKSGREIREFCKTVLTLGIEGNEKDCESMIIEIINGNGNFDVTTAIVEYLQEQKNMYANRVLGRCLNVAEQKKNKRIFDLLTKPIVKKEEILFPEAVANKSGKAIQ